MSSTVRRPVAPGCGVEIGLEVVAVEEALGEAGLRVVVAVHQARHQRAAGGVDALHALALDRPARHDVGDRVAVDQDVRRCAVEARPQHAAAVDEQHGRSPVGLWATRRDGRRREAHPMSTCAFSSRRNDAQPSSVDREAVRQRPRRRHGSRAFIPAETRKPGRCDGRDRRPASSAGSRPARRPAAAARPSCVSDDDSRAISHRRRPRASARALNASESLPRPVNRSSNAIFKLRARRLRRITSRSMCAVSRTR